MSDTDRPADEPRTTSSRVRVALGEDPQLDTESISAISDDALAIFMDDAHSLVERRCVPYLDPMNDRERKANESALEETERYVAADKALPSITGTATGSMVERRSAADVSINYDTDAGKVELESGRVVTEHWARALRADPSGRLGVRVRKPYYERRR